MEVVARDVVVLGGGPAGSITAALLSRAGVSVTLIERARFPRFHVGESLAPGSLTVLDELDLSDTCDERYIRKYGVRFMDCRTGRQQRYDYTEAGLGEGVYAWQVPRADFDERLLKKAREYGTDVREGCAAEDILVEQGRTTGVRALWEGQRIGFTARVLVDATGNDSLLATRLGHREAVAGMDRSVLCAHFVHATRNTDDTEGDLDAVLFPHGWVYNVPFLGDVNSVGAVCSSTWMRTRTRGETLDSFFQRTLEDASFAREMLSPATRLTPVQHLTGYAHRSSVRAGHGWLLVGDSAGFFDPMFCAGTHLAIAGAAEAATAVLDALAARDVSPERFTRYSNRIERAMDLYQGLTQSLYTGDLTEAIFSARTRAARQPLAAVLAGNVLGDDPPWRAALRAKYPIRKRA
jgi:flavin-dependent dehydrogenase